MSNLPPLQKTQEEILSTVFSHSLTIRKTSQQCQGTQKDPTYIYHQSILPGDRSRQELQTEDEESLWEKAEWLFEIHLGKKITVLEKAESIWVCGRKDLEGEQEKKEREIVEGDHGEVVEE